MSQKSKFRGCAQDYLDWFQLDYTQKNKIILPETQTDGLGLRSEEEEKKICHQKMKQFCSGRDYAWQYQLEHQHEDKAIIEGKVREINSLGIEEDTMTTDCDQTESGYSDHKAYIHYDMRRQTQQTNLPIASWEKEIVAKVEAYPVVVIEGETGCGKSTQVPQYIFDAAVEANKYVNIVVTQPRKIAAVSLAKKISEERGWKLGSLVGYQVGLDNNTSIDTCISYVTTEVLVQKIIHQKSVGKHTHIILDEVHERDEHTDFALLIIKKLINTVARNVKVILMSATIDVDRFAKYYSTLVQGYLVPAPVISITSHSPYSVDIFYLDSIIAAFKDIKVEPLIKYDDPNISAGMFNLATEMVKRFDNYERKEEGITGNSEFAKSRGAVLIFLPGLFEIEEMIISLRKEAARNKWHMYPLHSSITIEEQKCVFAKPPQGFRKIIVSTNIAESSITVSDIKFVIDFCLTKILTCDPNTNYTCLKLDWASQASCRQRAGRAGRVSSGRVFRLVSRKFYETLMMYTTPELCRSPLTQVVLKTKLLDMGQPQALLALALDPPDLGNIHHTILTLKQMCALGVKYRGLVTDMDGDLTYLGRIMAHLPLDPHLSKFIVFAHLFGCLREAIIISAGLCLKPFHARPFQDELNAYLSKVSWAYGSFSDCFAILNTYLVWQNYHSSGQFTQTGRVSEKNWARESYVELKALHEVHTLVKEITERLEKLKITPVNRQNPPKKNQYLILKMLLAAACYPHYFRRYVPDEYEKEMCRELNGHDPFSTVIVSRLPAEMGIVYDRQLREMLKECGQDMLINYMGTKAYIEFPRRKSTTRGHDHFSDIPGECPTAMYLALKMRTVRRLQDSFALKVYSPEEARQHMQTIKSLGKCVQLPEQGYRSLTSYEMKTSAVVTTLKAPELPAATQHTWSVYVTHVEDPGHFWVMCSREKTFQDLGFIQSTISLAHKSRKLCPLVSGSFAPGFVCVAPFSENPLEEPTYYRARVEDIHAGQDGNLQALVYFVDFGNSEQVAVKDLREMPPKLMEIQMLAVECYASHIKGASKEVDSAWSPEAHSWFCNNALQKQFTAQIYSVVHHIVRLELLNIEQRGAVISISQSLKDQGFALSAEEPYLSKQNHELRAIYTDEVENTLEENTTAISSLDLAFSDKVGGRKVWLRGPASPLELKFVALTRVGCMKAIKVESSSVNSTVLDLEPQNPHDRFIVAAFVSLNPSETSLMLRDTTLMPSLPGILPLSLLLFAPQAELRVDETKQRYTGAIFGLGVDPTTGEAIYPDDDIELAFDIPFTQEDLIMINKIRYLINAVFEEDEMVPEKMLLTTQNRLREFLQRLLDVPRNYKEPEAFTMAYQWNMISPEDVLQPCLEGAFERSESQVLPLHNAVFMTKTSPN
ncbi:tudor domain containing 9 protein spindle E isoform X2 [Oratosquilla oratoria]|uniref:tudor domain containing 9 protein spindle E isoform X2 n=1 Tax=Oratosquilla oratoria TaxID=337810 RepID=UPI003F76FF29